MLEKIQDRLMKVFFFFMFMPSIRIGDYHQVIWNSKESKVLEPAFRQKSTTTPIQEDRVRKRVLFGVREL